MYAKWWIVLILPALVFSGVAPRYVQAAQAVVTDMRVGVHEGKTRFVFDLTDRVRFGVFTLADPYRVVIDLPEVGWRLPAQPLPSHKGLLDTLRYGLFKQGVSRVVMDVAGPAAIDAAFMLEPSATHGFRIVVDLAATSREAFLESTRSDGIKVTASMSGGDGMGLLSVPRADIPVPTAQPPMTQPIAAISPPRKPARPSPRRVIALDPGHGGVDPGTVGVSGAYEKQITLSAAREIKRMLELTGRFSVVLTRDRDIFVQLRDRVAIAREAGAELFVSIHADAIKDRNIRGLSVYTLSETASDKEAATLADKENKADLIAGINLNGKSADVTNILIELAQRETMNQSALFAAELVKQLSRQTKLLRNTHRFAGFAVLKAPDVPSVLLELGFLSNQQEERALRSKEYRDKLAVALTNAVESYFTDVEQASRR
ncbi:MAG: hypothetical protein A3G18_03955 [Rhodospirillales bacterium RIFCSPLOWO2_12_FULL_58_28]|nr:MAG: hypothetical protein A3H92_04835 [Rhodospirillales bacterium RIFCSPLOWO2_02_FULL_58_16]OHC78679.1 MAG: hypothetical protein A3G18_03955 [Rhodospirillales bacterium RIFCSPLOWO2_12_FULL_58_28]